MRIHWASKHMYRGFYAPSLRHLTIVSSNLVDDAHGMVLNGGLTLVVADDGGFCDLELTALPGSQQEYAVWPGREIEVVEEVETLLAGTTRAEWFIEKSPSRVSIKVLAAQPERWFCIKKDSLFVGISNRRYLAGIVFNGIENDPDGHLSGAWLDEVENSSHPVLS